MKYLWFMAYLFHLVLSLNGCKLLLDNGVKEVGLRFWKIEVS